MNYDPKLLEAYFRFMAELSKQGAQTTEFFKAASSHSPDLWADMMPSTAQIPEGLEAFWEAAGFVPKARYDALEEQYLALKSQVEAAMPKADAASDFFAKGQEQKAKDAMTAWSKAIQTTLETQAQLLSSWVKESEEEV